MNNLKKVDKPKVGGAIPNFDEWKVQDLKKLYNLLELNGLDKNELIERLKTHFEDDKKDMVDEVHLSPPQSPPPELVEQPMPNGLSKKEIKAIYNKRYRDKLKLKLIPVEATKVELTKKPKTQKVKEIINENIPVPQKGVKMKIHKPQLIAKRAVKL